MIWLGPLDLVRVVESGEAVSPTGTRLRGIRSLGNRKAVLCRPKEALRSLTSLNLASMQFSNRHFQRMMLFATSFGLLDISNCPALDQIVIFQAKESLPELLQHITISSNRQFTILAIVCLCS